MSLRRVYETTIIVNAALEEADIESVISKVTGYIENHGAEIFETNKWGRRRLAYPINKKYNGFYIHVVFESSPSAIPIFERFLVLEDTILRHLTLVLPEKLREFRAKRALQAGTTNAPATIESQPKIGKALAIKEKKAAEIAAKEARRKEQQAAREEAKEIAAADTSTEEVKTEKTEKTESVDTPTAEVKNEKTESADTPAEEVKTDNTESVDTPAEKAE